MAGKEREFDTSKLMLPRAQRITTREFREAFENSRVLRHPLMQVRLHWRASSEDAPVKAAFVVSRKLGKATVRNRARRRVREIYRLSALRHDAALCHADLLFFISAQGVDADNRDLQEALEQLLRRATSGRESRNRGSREQEARTRVLEE